ncbi:MAG: MBL fold metallo-hydrolase, partial [Pseudomonadota bacterium]
VIDGLKLMGEDFSSAMYYIVGDWMRGTEVVLPKTVITEDVEEIGGHRFRSIVLAGHTDCDLVVVDETSGVVFAGDLIFLNRAPTTPHADLDVWRQSLRSLDDAVDPQMIVVPGHGPAEATRAGRVQTERWLDDIEKVVRDCFDRGLSATEAISEPLPEWTSEVLLARYEYERTILHLFPKLESGNWPRVDTFIE